MQKTSDAVEILHKRYKRPSTLGNTIYHIWYLAFFPIAFPFAFAFGWLYSKVKK